MKGFIIYPTYRVEGDTAYVYLYGRQENGETFLTRNAYRPYFYIRKADEAVAKQLAAAVTFERAGRKNFDDETLLKITLANPKDVPAVRDVFEQAGLLTYEADVRFAYRFMMDHHIQGSCEIIGEPQPHAHVDCYYEEPKFARSDWVCMPKVLAIDIETGKRGEQLYCVSLVGNNGWSTVLVVSDTPVVSTEGKSIETFPTEKACLEAFCAKVREYDPDIITGWSVIDFDLKTLEALCAAQQVPFVLGRTDDRVRLRLDKHFFRDSTADIQGRQVLDGIMLLKASFIKLDDYKLGTAAHDILGDAKSFDGGNKLAQIENAYANDKASLAEYCRKDSELVLKILAKKQLIELAVQRSLLTGLALDRLRASIASLDSLYLRELAARGYAAKTHVYQEKEEQITGGYVMESTPGIYDYVIVCDFKSLYPSIMRTLNIDPLSYLPEKHLPKSTAQYIVAENGAVFKNTNGILPDILEKLHKARDEHRKTKNTVAIYAIKVLMNSFFGSLASPQCRFFSMEVANAITVSAQHVTKTAAQLIRDKGYNVIYGDTDSLFVDLTVTSLDEANAIGKQIEADVNAHFAVYMRERYHRESKLELQFEKTFVRFFMPMTRGGESSKKRYAGLRIIDGKEKIDFTGLEFVRRDWTDLAKEFQLSVLDKIFHGEDVTAYVKEYVADLKAGKKDDKLVYKKQLRKELDEYTKTTPSHVKAARKMEGTLMSSIIEYIQTEDGPQPIEARTSPIDYQHYIDKQIKPLANSVLVFYNTNFDDLMSGSSQRGLFEF